MEQRRSIQDDYAIRNERIHAVDQLIRAFTIYEKMSIMSSKITR